MTQSAVVYIHRLILGGVVKKGGLDQVIDHLLREGYTITLFEFPLDYTDTLKVTVSQKTNHDTNILSQFNMPRVFAQVNWILEIFIMLYLTIRYVRKSKLVLTSDPLTTLPALLLKFIGFYKFIYYHSVDYSTDRFKNKLFNGLYFILLKFGLKYADLVGVVTVPAKNRLQQLRSKEIFFIPNSPDFHSLDTYRKPIFDRIAHSLIVTVSHVAHKYLIHEMVSLVHKLKSSYPDIVLYVVGFFDEKSEYCIDLKAYIETNALQSNIIFCGSVTREKNYELISKARVGLAYYDGNFSHVIFGDAIKIREYCALGLPTVADSHTHTAVEMANHHAGFIAEDFVEAEAKVRLLFDDANLYKNCSDQAIAIAKKYDKKLIMSELLKKFTYE